MWVEWGDLDVIKIMRHSDVNRRVANVLGKALHAGHEPQVDPPLANTN